MTHARFLSVALLLCGTLLSACGGHGDPYTPPPSPMPSSSIAQVRFVEGSPLLEASVNGNPVPLGTQYLAVNGLTVAQNFPYQSITQFLNVTAGAASLKVADSEGFEVGPIATPALTGGKRYTVVIVGTFPKYSAIAFEEPAAGSGATLAAYGASPTVPSADYGRYTASTHSGFKKLGTVGFGKLATTSLGHSVSDLGGYVGKGTVPAGAVSVVQADSFDTAGKLPYGNATRFSLFFFDAAPGSTTQPVVGKLDP